MSDDGPDETLRRPGHFNGRSDRRTGARRRSEVGCRFSGQNCGRLTAGCFASGSTGVHHLKGGDRILRTLIRSEIGPRWAFSDLDREMRREQREKWRREINDEILPSLRIEQMTGDSDATSRQNRAHFEKILQLCGLYRWLFHRIPNVVFSHPENSKIAQEQKGYISFPGLTFTERKSRELCIIFCDSRICGRSHRKVHNGFIRFLFSMLRATRPEQPARDAQTRILDLEEQIRSQARQISLLEVYMRRDSHSLDEHLRRQDQEVTRSVFANGPS
jgi:hypothetical protein